MKIYNCPNCGAPIKHYYNYNCEYCGTFIDHQEEKVEIVKGKLFNIKCVNISNDYFTDSIYIYIKAECNPNEENYVVEQSYDTFVHKVEDIKEIALKLIIPIQDVYSIHNSSDVFKLLEYAIPSNLKKYRYEIIEGIYYYTSNNKTILNRFMEV